MTQRRPRFSDDDRAAVRGRVDLVSYVGQSVKLTRRGNLHTGCCPFHFEKTGSFKIYEREGFFHCFGCGAHGDVITFAMRFHGLTFPEAMAGLMDRAGILSDSPQARDWAQEQREHEARIESERLAHQAQERAKATQIYGQRQPATGTLVQDYFASRGLSVPVGAFPVLGFLPAAKYWVEDDDTDMGFRLIGFFPAIVAPFHHCLTRDLTGVHLTFLNADGTKLVHADPVTGEILNPRKIRGSFSGAAIMMRRPSLYLGIGEGWETVASVFQASLCLPKDHPLRALPVWAAGSLDNLAGRGRGRGGAHPDDPTGKRRLPSIDFDPDWPGVMPPPGVQYPVLLEDGDTKDLAAGHAIGSRAIARWRAAGTDPKRFCSPKGVDFNDLIRGKNAPETPKLAPPERIHGGGLD